MARGRMINTTVATDKRLADLPLEAELLYLKTIPHLDRDGLILGDASILWAQVCPRRAELLDHVENYVDLWIASGLVHAYDTPDGRVLHFPNFAKNQVGFRYDREPASTIQCPPGYTRMATGLFRDAALSLSGNLPEVIRQPSGNDPAEVKRKEKKRKENSTATLPATLPPAAQTFIDHGGKWPSGKLADGTAKRAKAIAYMAEHVEANPASLAFWGQVVAGYCAQWSSKSYMTMVNDYYLENRIPGESVKRGNNGRGPGEVVGKTTVQMIHPDGIIQPVETTTRANR